jgi:hypothetical protein
MLTTEICQVSHSWGALKLLTKRSRDYLECRDAWNDFGNLYRGRLLEEGTFFVVTGESEKGFYNSVQMIVGGYETFGLLPFLHHVSVKDIVDLFHKLWLEIKNK